MPYIRMDQIPGYYTVKQLAEELGVNRHTIQGRITRGKFPAPSHTVAGGRRLYYTEDEVNNFRLVFGTDINKETK